MRTAALVFIFGLTGVGVVRMNPAGSGLSSAGLATQSTAGGAPAETSAKMRLTSPKNLEPQLQPDQTATAEVTVTYPKAIVTSAPADSEQTKKRPTGKSPAKKPKAPVKKAPKKRSEPPKQVQNQPPDQGTTSEPAVAVKFYLNMSKTEEYPACVASVTPLIGEPSLKPGDDPLNVPISITSCNPKGGKGTLFLSGTKAPGVPVTLKQRNSSKLFYIVIGSLIVAVLICVFAGKAVTAGGHELSDMMTQVSWDFSTSWASNITAFGAAFVFLLNFGAGLDKPHLASKGEYQFIAAFALALAMLAPAIHRLASETKVVNPPQDNAMQSEQHDQSEQDVQSDPTVVTVGFVGGFLAASAFTIWGTLLQNAGELLIVYELKKAGTLYGPILIVVGICVAVTAVLLMIYCWKGILSTVAANSRRTGRLAGKPRTAFLSAPANWDTIVRRAISGRKAAVL